MIVVKVELWPGGKKRRAETLRELRIANVSELSEVSNYVWALHDPVNLLAPEKQGYVRGHRRSDGIMVLLGKVFKEMDF